MVHLEVHRLMYYRNPFKWFIESQNRRKTFAYWFNWGETRFLNKTVVEIYSSSCLVILLLVFIIIVIALIFEIQEK